ncbi:MAG: TonB-dependent receptor [Bacteroidetes bacterium]|nr:TonB-dependent receptor [Bacteroidota bacterium]
MKIFKLSFFALFASLFLSSSIIAHDASIYGRISDSGSVEYLAYVHVQLSNVSEGSAQLVVTAITDKDGKFRFSQLDAGQYRLSIRHIGYQMMHYGVDLADGAAGETNLTLNPSQLELGEVSVSSLRYDKMERAVVHPIEVISGENFPKQSAVSMSDVLSREPGIALYRDGAWGTSVSIRGLGENRLVAMINGNRIETATDLAGGLSMLDVNEIERVEIIKGAASSIYGTGAMGGILNVITKKGNYQENMGIHGEATGYYEGVNKLRGSHIGIEAGDKKWYARFSGGYRKADDTRTPDGILENSQFNDINFNASVGVKPFKKHEFRMEAQEFRANNVGIPGGAPLGPFATASYTLAQRRMFSGTYSIRDISDRLEKISLKYYHQFIGRDVLMLPNTPSQRVGNNRITATKITPDGFHYTNGFVLESRWKVSAKNHILAGVDLWQRRIETSREKYITQEILDDFDMVQQVMEIVKGEKPIPDARFSSAGIFIQDEFSLMDGNLDMSIGARLDGIQVANEQGIDPVSLVINGNIKDPVPGQRVVFEAQTQLDFSWSANLGALYHLNESVDVTVNAGRSFRSPSIEERFKYIDLGSKVRIGDPDLKPEKGWFGDLGMRVWEERFTAQLNGFVNYLTDMIVEMPGEFEYYLVSTNDLNLIDTIPALINTNVDRALLTGFEAKANYLITKSVVVWGKAAYVRGIDINNKSDLPLIAPFSASAGFRYQLPGLFSIEWTTSAVSAQNKVAEGETTTDGYFVSDFSLFSTPRQFGVATFQIFAGVDNIFNKDYTNHLATNRGQILVEPGRNVFVKLQMKF